MECTWISIDNAWVSLDIRWMSTYSIDLHGLPREIHGLSMDICGLCMDFHVYPRIIHGQKGGSPKKHGSMGVQDAQWISSGNAWTSKGMRGGSAGETDVAFRFGVTFQRNSGELKGHSKILLSRMSDDLFDTVVQSCDASKFDLVALWEHSSLISQNFPGRNAFNKNKIIFEALFTKLL